MIFALAAALAVLAGPKPPAPAAAPRVRPAVEAEAPKVYLDAAEVHYSPRRREVVAIGTPVTMTREDAKLTCARLVAKTDDKRDITSAVCTGDVRFVRGERTVTCDTATYDNVEARLTCVGNTMMQEGGTEAHGERLTYDLRSDETSLQGASGKPVVVTVPGEQVEQHRREYEERKQTRAPKPEVRK